MSSTSLPAAVSIRAVGRTAGRLHRTARNRVRYQTADQHEKSSHRYASHGLRFAVKRSLETLDQFRLRINRAAAAEEGGGTGSSTGGDEWFLGGIRDRGSIHSDIWRGSAADLAGREAVGVFPISGWWKEKPKLNRWDRSTRYALIVTIRAPEAEVDLYAAIENRLAVEIPAV